MEHTHGSPCEHCSTLFKQQEKRIQELEALAFTDHLTELPNRRAFMSGLERVIAHARRDGRVLCVAMCDVDFFKNINDTYGHEAGDVVLQQLGRLLMRSCREEDIVARIGGEEFAIVLVDTNLKQAHRLIERLRKEIEQHLKVHREKNEFIHATASFGVTQMKPIEPSQSFLARADAALYQAKKSGRNCVVPTSNEE